MNNLPQKGYTGYELGLKLWLHVLSRFQRRIKKTSIIPSSCLSFRDKDIPLQMMWFNIRVITPYFFTMPQHFELSIWPLGHLPLQFTRLQSFRASYRWLSPLSNLDSLSFNSIAGCFVSMLKLSTKISSRKIFRSKPPTPTPSFGNQATN